jgi:hypothetical protein
MAYNDATRYCKLWSEGLDIDNSPGHDNSSV